MHHETRLESGRLHGRRLFGIAHDDGPASSNLPCRGDVAVALLMTDLAGKVGTIAFACCNDPV
jgi:hypothetical protein